jgi:hypothetical protein
MGKVELELSSTYFFHFLHLSKYSMAYGEGRTSIKVIVLLLLFNISVGRE